MNDVYKFNELEQFLIAIAFFAIESGFTTIPICRAMLSLLKYS